MNAPAVLVRRDTAHRFAPSAVRDGIAMMSGRGAQTALGFCFWVLAARWFRADVVGLTAAALASIMLCTQLANLGVGAALISWLPRHRSDPSPLLDTCITVAAVSAAVTSLAFLLVGSTWLDDVRRILGRPAFGVAFVVMEIGRAHV